MPLISPVEGQGCSRWNSRARHGIDALPLTAARNERSDQVTEPRQRSGRRPIRELIARELSFSGQPMSATQIAKAIEYLPNRTQAALERMEHAGQVVRNEGGRWAIGLSTAPQANGHPTGAGNGELHAPLKE